jgi:hypothetical protein
MTVFHIVPHFDPHSENKNSYPDFAAPFVGLFRTAWDVAERHPWQTRFQNGVALPYGCAHILHNVNGHRMASMYGLITRSTRHSFA